jgi:hypothetical protein
MTWQCSGCNWVCQVARCLATLVNKLAEVPVLMVVTVHNSWLLCLTWFRQLHQLLHN